MTYKEKFTNGKNPGSTLDTKSQKKKKVNDKQSNLLKQSININK